MQVFKSKDFFKHKNSSRLHFGHKRLTHFGCANGFSKFCHVFFRRCFFSRCDAYWWFFSLVKHPSYIRHFVIMRHLSTFYIIRTLFPSFSFLSFSECVDKRVYVGVWGHYGSRVVVVYSWPFNEVPNLTINLLWWYKPFIYGRLCPIYFSRELSFGDSIFVL